jgi:hypothetical protein
VQKIQNLAFSPYPNGRRFFSLKLREVFKARLLQDEQEQKSDEKICTELTRD